MTPEKHLQKAEEIEQSLNKLLPDPRGKNVAAAVELCYGIAQHLISVGCERQFKEHKDTHVGLSNFLRQRKQDRIANLFIQLDQYRAGRWYGGQTNGKVIKDCLNILKQIKQWINKKD